MKTIWKMPLIVEDIQDISLPKESTILSIQFQHGMLCLWAEVDTESSSETRMIEIYGTGHRIYGDMGIERKYIATVQEAEGNLVWHIYERLS